MFGILGRLEVRGAPVAGEKLRALLARLVLEANRPVPAERLIEDLWGEDPPATARQTLHAHVTRLRRLIGDDAALVNDGGGYALRVTEDQVDALRFRAEIDAARALDRQGARPEAVRDRYAAALGLWRGPMLEDVPLPDVQAECREFEDLRAAAQEARIDLDLELGRGAELEGELERLLALDPLRERLWGQLMLVLYGAGRQADALAAYQRARHELDAVGLEPGPALREVERRVLQQDPGLVARPIPRARAPRSRRRAPAVALLVAALAVAAVAALAARDDQTRAAHRAASRAVAVPGDSLAEIDPRTGDVRSVTPVGRGPDAVTVTTGAVWVSNSRDRTVSRVALPGRRVRTVGGAPVAHQLVATLDGDVWLSGFEEPVVARVGTDGHRPPPQAPVKHIRVGGSAEALATGGGYLWVTSPVDSGGDDTVTRIDLRTDRVVARTPVGNLPLFMTFGYGSAWVSNFHDDSLTVVRPGTAHTETVEVPGGPLGVAAGAGAIWVVTYFNRKLVRIDPDTRRVVARIPLGAGPLSVAVGGGSVWVTNRDARAVSRIDPATDRVVSLVRLESSPWGVAYGRGRVWVTTQRCGGTDGC